MNPVLHKDILTLLRLKRIAAIQLLFVVLLAALVLISWPQGGVLSLSASTQDDLLLGLILGQMVVLILTVPGVAAVSLTGEREANTFEMLYASRLSAVQIISGKVMSAVAFPVLLILSGLPFVGLLNFRGAVDVNALLWSYLILIVTAVLLAVLSLTVSAMCRQTSSALVISYLVSLVVCGGVLVPAAIMFDSAGGPVAMGLFYGRALSPLAAVLSLLRPGISGDFAGINKPQLNLIPSHQIFFAVAGLAMVVCLVMLVIRLSKPPAETDRADDPNPKRMPKAFGFINPMFTKERRTNSLSSGRWMVRIFYGMLVLSLMLSLMSLSGGTEHPDLLRYVFQVLVAFQIVGLAAIVPSLTTPAISAEIETGTFEVLRLTRLSGGKIFWGKFLPAFLPAILPIIALLPAYGTVCFLNHSYISYLIYVMPIVLLTMVFCCVLGLLCSTFFANSARATVVAYILISALIVLPMIAWWAAGAGLIDNEKLVGWVSMPSPLVVGLSVAPVTNVNGEPPAGNAVASLRFTHECIIGAACIVMLIVARIRLAILMRQG